MISMNNSLEGLNCLFDSVLLTRTFDWFFDEAD